MTDPREEELDFSFQDISNAIHRLAHSRLLALEGEHRRAKLVSLRVPSDSVLDVLQDQTRIPWLADISF